MPFIERLMMPARSEIASPMDAKTTGPAAARTPARPSRSTSPLMSCTRLSS